MVHIKVDVVNIEEVGILDIWGKPTRSGVSRVSKPGGLFGVVGLGGSGRGPIRRKHGGLLALYLPRPVAKPALSSHRGPLQVEDRSTGAAGGLIRLGAHPLSLLILIHSALHPISVASCSFHLLHRMARAAKLLVFDANITPALNANLALVTVSPSLLWCQ